METKIRKYLSSQPKEWQSLLNSIHEIIMKEDTTVVPVVEPMMRKEMIVYKAKGMMKYGLAGNKQYMSLHVLPIYMSPPLFNKYKALLPKASFQKGGINFKSGDEMPLNIVQRFIDDSSVVDLLKIREDYLKKKKAKAKK